MGGKASLSCLIKTEGIQKHIHLYQDERAYGCSFRQIRRPAFRDIRSVGENKGNQGDTDISRIGKHGAVFKSFPLSGIPVSCFGNKRPDDAKHSHEDKGNNENVEERKINLCHINAVKNETGKNDVKGQFGQRIDVEPETPVHEVADSHKD